MDAARVKDDLQRAESLMWKGRRNGLKYKKCKIYT